MYLSKLIEIRDLLSEHMIFSIGILLVFGYFLGKIASKLKLPAITGYIIAGLLVGETFLGVIKTEMSHSLKIVTDVALGLIALTIGGEFYFAKLKRLGKKIFTITLFQLFLSFIMVTIALYLFDLDLPFALLLGAIASATAPAATVAIVQTLRARGIFIDYLYGIVGLDDAGCVILFGIIFALVSGMIGGNSVPVHKSIIIIHAFEEIFFSILTGLVFGYLVHIFTIKKNNNNEIMIIALGLIFINLAVSIVFHLSPLITNMTAGCIIINMSSKNHRIYRILEPLTPPIYALFFIIAGTELRPEILLHKEILLLGSVYIIFRAIGKYAGVYLGCIASKADDKIKNYLGLCMMPQAGVAIGLVLYIQASPIIQDLDPASYKMILNMINIVLMSVFVNELIGPLLSKIGIILGNDMEE